MTLTADQRDARLDGITATDVGAIVGLNPFRTRLSVWLEKTGQSPAFVETPRSRWGHILEAPIREDYEQQHNVRVEVPTTMRHPKSPWRIATPDGLVYPEGFAHPERGLEIKTHGRDVLWHLASLGIEYGQPGTDEVLQHELAQCAWGMHVTGLDRWDLVAFLDGAPVEYTIQRDDELIDMMADEAERFLVDHVRPRVPPPPDGSKEWTSWLKRRWKSADRDDLIEVDGDEPTMELIAQLKDVRALLRSAETEHELYKQRLKAAIGQRGGMTFTEPGRKKPSAITWRFTKDRVNVDHEAVAAEQRQLAAFAVQARGAQLDALIASYREAGAAGDVARDALTDALATLRDIADSSVEIKHTTTTSPGPRTFLAPRHWAKKADEAKTTTKQQGDTDDGD